MAAIGETLAAIGIKTAIEEVLLQEAQAIAFANEDVDPLYSVLANAVSGDQPLLAHYTSIRVMESILKNGEVWFSNPLFMNDLQEMKSGLNEGMKLFSNIETLKIVRNPVQRGQRFQRKADSNPVIADSR